MDSVAFSIIDISQKHNYGEINNDSYVEDGLYVVKFTSIPYTLHY